MKSLCKQQKQSLETLLWNPAIQTLYTTTLLTPDSPFHCSHAPAHLSQLILQAATHTKAAQHPLAVPRVCYRYQSHHPSVVLAGRLSSSLCSPHFAATVYILQLQYSAALLSFTEQPCSRCCLMMCNRIQIPLRDCWNQESLRSGAPDNHQQHFYFWTFPSHVFYTFMSRQRWKREAERNMTHIKILPLSFRRGTAQSVQSSGIHFPEVSKMLWNTGEVMNKNLSTR